MKQTYALLIALILLFPVTTIVAQTTPVFSDNFDRSSFTDGSTGGTPSTTYNFTLGNGNIATTFVSGSNYRVALTSSTGGSAANHKGYFTAPLTIYSAPFNPILSSNVGLVTWTFNMRLSSAATAVPTQNVVGGGVDLCGNAATNIYNGAPTGYAVIFNSGSTGGVSLVKYSGGLSACTTIITQTTTVSKTDYYSVRVTYNPVNNNWSLFVRDDGSSTFGDPSSGVTLQQGSTVTDATYTSQSNTNFGAILTYTATAGITMLLDNYTVGIAQCTGAPAPGNTLPSASTACLGFTDNLGLQNATSGIGISYVWESAPDVSGSPGTYAPTGATDATYTATVAGPTWYKCDVTCAYSSTTTSNQVKVGVSAAPAPISGSPVLCSGGTSTLSDAVTGGTWSSDNTSVATVSSSGLVTAIALGGANISYTLSSTGCSASIPAMVITTPPTPTVSPSAAFLCSGGNATLNASSIINLIPVESWESGVPNSPGTAVDGWNCIGGNSSYFSQQTGSGLSNPSISSAQNGSYFLDFNSFSLNNGNATLYSPSFNMAGIPSAQISMWVWRDYASSYTGATYAAEGFKVAINTTNSTTGAVLLGTVPRDAQTAISGTAISGTSTTTSSGWYQYTFSIPSTFNGSTNYLLIVATSKFGNDCYLDNVSITSTLNAVWSPTTNLFTDAGFTAPYTGTQASPVYYQSPSITSPSNIIYSASVACASKSVPVSVNPIPSAIIGSTNTCTGTTTTLSNSSTGGIWASSNTTAGTISTAGVLTNISLGTTNISYSFAGCGTATTTVTVNTAPNASSFSFSAGTTCVGASIPFTINSSSLVSGNYTVNYTLSGANTGTGSATTTMSGTSGIFTIPGVSTTGSTTLTINSVVNISGCGVTPTGNTTTFTVNPLPSSISGTPVVCIGTTSVLSDVGGGSWFSNDASIATINFTAGIIAGISAGNTTITYTLPTGCTRTTTITVNSTSPITGSTGTCIGTSTTLSDAAAGSWTSSNTAIATVGSGTGIVSGISLGTINITFTDAHNGCPVFVPIAITATPSVFITTGGGAGCAGGVGVHVYLNHSSIGYSYQLFTSGSLVGATFFGTGFPIDFGAVSTSGVYTVIANPGSACATTMFGSATVTVNPLPSAYPINGGGGFCTSDAGVHVGLTGSDAGINYQLFKNGVALGSPLPGTGATVDFGLETAAGTYTAVATNSLTGCVNNMTGSTTVTINPLPSAFSITGGGGYCPGSAGSVVGLSSSTSGISYQLLLGGTPSGSAIVSSGSALSFGPQTGTGTYTVAATNPATGCASAMSGSRIVSVNPLPTSFNVTGGGIFCVGGSGVHIGLDGSGPAVNYQLYNGTTPVGGTVSGTGSNLDFGLLTSVGTYTVSATSTVTTCANNMNSSATVTTNALPNAYALSGGGSYCLGGSGYDVSLSASDAGISYQLYMGTTPIGAPIVSGGGSVDFGIQTVAGTYTAIATNTATGCTQNMTGTATIILKAAPAAFSVTGGGSYCSGSTSTLHVGLSRSATGVNYQLYNAGSTVGAAVGGSAGLPLDFGVETLPGAYTVVATNNATGCTSNMTGSASININPLPTAYSVGGGGGYCSGTTGAHITLNGSDIGISYQLYSGTSISGSPLAGTGSTLDLGAVTAITTYTVSAVNTSTGCANNMTGSATVSVNALPTPFPVTTGSGGVYCAGGIGVPVGLPASTAGISYQLYLGGAPAGTAVIGSGGPVTFGSQTAGTYSVIGSNITTGCTSNMTGTVTVSTNPLPVLHTVTGGGAYCAGSTTGIAVTLTGSNTGTTYVLYNSGSSTGITVAGTGSPLSFGPVTVTGPYTIQATNTLTTCSVNMLSSVIVTTNPLPTAATVTGGGTYCSGGTGVNVSLTGSNTGINYQLYNGTSLVGSPAPGTGSLISFGLETSAGTYTVLATDASTHCSSNMTSTAIVSITSVPVPYTVTGGGGYCPGSGSVIGVGGSLGGVNYILYLGGVSTGISVTGTGGTITYGPQTATGTYTVVASDPLSTCSGPMTGSVSVSVNPLPTGYLVSGGGDYCAGGTGLHVGVAGSQTGTVYQLYNNGSVVGIPVSGTGSRLDFGLETAPGNYEVIATNRTTSCTNAMNDTVLINLNPLPFAFALSGGGNFCGGTSTGAPISVVGSSTGTNYQLYNGTTAVGTAVAGTSAHIDFGTFTTPGVYSLIGTNIATGCSGPMANNDTIAINPLPTLYAVTGGGNYCSGSTGSNVGLANSQTGVTYELYNSGLAAGSPITGTGSSISFGAQTATGVYTIAATNNTTGCTSNMTGSATIGINPLPAAYTVTGGGSYCAGGAGVLVGLSGSASGISYQLLDGGIATGSPAAATGSAISFGLKTAAGHYTVVATNSATGCRNNMNDSVAVSVATSPNIYIVSGSSAGYCAGGTGVRIYSSGSDAGVYYQLYRGTLPIGLSLAGTATGLDFGAQTVPGTYTVIGTEGIGGCTGTMTGSPSVVIDPVPNVYTVTGGGNYCPGSAGVHIGLSGSQTGISYQPILTGSTAGSAITGTGSPADFGAKTAAGIYTVLATSPAGCTATMTGDATIVTSSLPVAYTTTGGGTYCSGGAGVNITLSNSTSGVGYQLYYGITAIGGLIPGTGTSINLGTETAAGNYTVTAINATTGCSSSMAGSATVSINPLPTAYSITGGGNYCAGAAGSHVGLANSATGISYKLYNGTSTVGSPISGTGTSIDFGAQTATGLYTITATNTATGCTANMSGTALVGISDLPTVYNVTGGGNYCTGTTGLHIRLSGSTAGIGYQLYNGITPVGSPVIGSGGLLDMGTSTTTGTYTVTGLNSTTGCGSNMTGSAAITVTSSVVPSVVVSTGGDNTICAGVLTTFSAGILHGGTAPSYQWSVNGTTVATTSTYSYLPLDGDRVSVTVTSNAQCAIPATADSSITMTVLPQEMPGITISATPGTTVCQGTSVTFSAIVINGGTTPAYLWKKNGAEETTAATYTLVPVTGDVIKCELGSSYRCRLANSVTSASKTMEADVIVTPDVVITADPSANIANGQDVTLNAIITNGVGASAYQWYINNIIVPGAISSQLIGNTFANLDNVTCKVTANSTCTDTPGVGAITLHVSNVGVQQVAAGSDIQLTPNPNKGTFNIKGTLAAAIDQEVTVEITDMIGQVIYTNKITAHNGALNENIHLANTLANGMYMLNLHCGTANKVFHMVIEQ